MHTDVNTDCATTAWPVYMSSQITQVIYKVAFVISFLILRKCGGRVSGRKVELLERFEFVSDGAISIIGDNIVHG